MSSILDSIVKSAKKSLNEKTDLPDGNAGKTDFDMKAQLEAKKKKVKKEADEKDVEKVVDEEADVEDENKVASSNAAIEKGVDVVKEAKKRMKKEADENEDDEILVDEEADSEDEDEKAVAESDDKDEDDMMDEEADSEDDEKKMDEEAEEDDEKKVEEEAEGEEEDDLEKDKIKIEKKLKKEDLNIDTHLKALFAGQKLSESFKKKAKTVFTAALTEAANKLAAPLREAYKSQYRKDVANFRKKYDTVMIEKIDGYMDDVVQEWWSANKVDASKNLKTELAESFLTELKNVFDKHYVHIDESKVDVIAQLSEKAESLEARLNKATNEKVALREQIEKLTKERIISESSSELSANEKDKLKTLAESLDFVSEKEFSERVKELVESYFTEQQVTNTVEHDEEPITVISESAAPKTVTEGQAYAEAISRLIGGKKNKTINKKK